MPSFSTSASPLSRMVCAMHVKSPFSHSALFGFIAFLLVGGLLLLKIARVNLLDFIGLAQRDAHVIPNHELRKLSAA
jgi:hypothetical protein